MGAVSGVEESVGAIERESVEANFWGENVIAICTGCPSDADASRFKIFDDSILVKGEGGTVFGDNFIGGTG